MTSFDRTNRPSGMYEMIKLAIADVGIRNDYGIHLTALHLNGLHVTDIIYSTRLHFSTFQKTFQKDDDYVNNGGQHPQSYR